MGNTKDLNNNAQYSKTSIEYIIVIYNQTENF